MQKNTLILLCLIAVGINGCGGDSRRIISEGRISKAELRDELDRFENAFIAMMKQSSAEISAEDQTRRVQRTNLRMRIRIIEALNAMTASDDSIVAFLDTWSLVIRLRMYLEEGDGSRIFGERQHIAVDFIRTAEDEMIRIGQLFLKQDELEQVQQDLEEFAQHNPIRGLYANLIVFPTLDDEEDKEQDSALMRTLSIPMAPIRAMEGVDNTATAIHNVRNSVERFTDVAEQLPESARWQMTIMMDDFEESKMTQSFLTSLKDFSQSSAQLVETLDSMPAELRAELLTVLEESDESQKQLQMTMQTATQVAVQLEKTFGELQNTSQSINETAAQATEAAVAWQSASDSIQELVGMFKTQTPRPPDAPPPFGMHDFNNMLTNAGQTADKITETIGRLDETIDTDIKAGTLAIRSLIDHTAWRLFQLALAVFGLVLVFFIIKKKLKSK